MRIANYLSDVKKVKNGTMEDVFKKELDMMRFKLYE